MYVFRSPLGFQRTRNKNKGLVLKGYLQNYGLVWLEWWKSGRIKNGEMIEKWEDRKNFNFSHFCLVGSEKVENIKNEFVTFTYIPLLKNNGQLK